MSSGSNTYNVPRQWRRSLLRQLPLSEIVRKVAHIRPWRENIRIFEDQIYSVYISNSNQVFWKSVRATGSDICYYFSLILKGLYCFVSKRPNLQQHKSFVLRLLFHNLKLDFKFVVLLKWTFTTPRKSQPTSVLLQHIGNCAVVSIK